ncbi:hypothetical protein EMIHUDRAFT_460471 [Emiliania huxleyi CCMP1516]|uniref:Uncharacterized protein n=2 Tax=Emiliania huxleyi TaxID=2903 RepID=A0A0D3KR90_EMIH1|nr:hypothetical protein EMIHUDRAFT_460471 [Emiliania huxleyi CCMP1516]EOD38275.1 hypothetical protein EMIHUDRAFT_460471 [Emiliania huxleyi CCMP1516]|eukprot:XP_005790704.1 hypothetical protein EMIHUDRAFT_460471 [Emiliania huxleyi CCMP1516]
MFAQVFAQTLALAAAGYLPPDARIAASRPCSALPRAGAIFASETREAGGQGPGAFLQRGLPKNQQPVREVQNLRREFLFDWPMDDGYTDKLKGLYGATMLVVSLPIAFDTYRVLPAQLPELLAAAHTGTAAFMVVAVLRLRLGWGFVQKRLKERVSYYEQNQRGFLAKKDDEAVLRDRLIEKSEVAPALRRIDRSLLPLLASLLVSTAALEISDVPVLRTLSGDSATRYTSQLRGDDEFAAAEQAKARQRMGGGAGEQENVKPLYCDSRYYKILAGGNSQGGVGCN